MKILVAPDKFKGSLSAGEVCEAISRGIKKVQPGWEIDFHPMADGGDGSLDVLSQYLNFKEEKIKTTDPIGREINASYFISGNSAFIEMARASGLVLLSEKERNPMLTSTLGTGVLIHDAIKTGCENIYLFLGGSATNDAGIGIAHALGFRFLDKYENELFPNGKNLIKINRIEKESDFDFAKINISLVCDVDNPLYGKSGAAYVYAKQKGATSEQIKLLDEGLRHFSEVIFQTYGIEIKNISGGGAAGGIGAGLYALLNAKIKPGFTIISELTGLEDKIRNADYVISGEGRLDEQSLNGKVIDGVAEMCRKYGKPLSLFVGKNELEMERLEALGVEHIFSISDQAKNVEDAMTNGAGYLTEIADYFTGHKS